MTATNPILVPLGLAPEGGLEQPGDGDREVRLGRGAAAAEPPLGRAWRSPATTALAA
jgi:hypothetical protein